MRVHHMTELEVKQICWAYLIENGHPTDGKWCFYGGDWDHVQSEKQWDDHAKSTDRAALLANVQLFGVDWAATDMPTFDVRSEFVGTDCPSNDTRTMIGALVLKNGTRVMLGCKDQPEYLETYADQAAQLNELAAGAAALFGAPKEQT